MTALVIGIIVGFLSCIPIGPINVWVVNTMIKHNFRSAFSIALGGATMDFAYFMIILTGMSFFKFSSSTVLTFKIIGVFLLLAFGLKEIFLTKPALLNNGRKKSPKVAGYFFMGAGIYTSNPTLVATMSALAAVIRSWNLFENSMLNYFFLSLGISAGSLLWFYLLLKVISYYKNRIPEKFYVNFARSCGILIVLFSLYMAINIYRQNVM